MLSTEDPFWCQHRFEYFFDRTKYFLPALQQSGKPHRSQEMEYSCGYLVSSNQDCSITFSVFTEEPRTRSEVRNRRLMLRIWTFEGPDPARPQNRAPRNSAMLTPFEIEARQDEIRRGRGYVSDGRDCQHPFSTKVAKATRPGSGPWRFCMTMKEGAAWLRADSSASPRGIWGAVPVSQGLEPKTRASALSL